MFAIVSSDDSTGITDDYLLGAVMVYVQLLAVAFLSAQIVLVALCVYFARSCVSDCCSEAGRVCIDCLENCS